MGLHGKNLIGTELSARGSKTFFGFDPKTGQHLETSFAEATEAEIERAMQLATEAFPTLREVSADKIAEFLEGIAFEIEALGDLLIDQAAQETGIGRDRLFAERGRTLGQLRMFAALVKDGSFVDARVDPALPQRQPQPRPDLRRMLIPIGPVVVFGASNFPLAFSVAGGDTASAFAAKNPVVVKGHPAHPGTSELVAGAILRAVLAAGLPEGTFSLVNVVDPAVSILLVCHRLTKAVAFTGSERAGRAILDAASRRLEPIPAYVEMGSTNPVFILPEALKERGEAIAEGLSNSINLGAGQFCTCPGLIFVPEGDGFAALRERMEKLFQQAAPATMVHPGILEGYDRSLVRVNGVMAVTGKRSTLPADRTKTEAIPVLFETDAGTWLGHTTLSEEVFGPSAMLIHARSEDELMEVANALPGTLTAAIHGTPDDLKRFQKLVAALETKAGRLILNDYPTGVEVTAAMHHGGPYPATGDAKFTSVGTAAILRFLRPVCYQGFPDESLPPELQAENPRNIWRTVDGRLTRDPIQKTTS